MRDEVQDLSKERSTQASGLDSSGEERGLSSQCQSHRFSMGDSEEARAIRIDGLLRLG